MEDTYSTIIKKQIHAPASYYFCSGFIPEFADQILTQINTYEENNIFSILLIMNESTYAWMFRLFTSPMEKEINPLTSTLDGKYIYDYPIKINNTLSDGIIIFNVGDTDELEQNK